MSFGRKGDVNIKIGAQDKTATAFKSAESRMKRMSSSAKGLATGFGALLGGRMIQGAVMNAIQYGSALTDAAIATRTNIEALQVFRAAARDAGASETNLEKAILRVHKAGVDAANGLSTYTRAFSALNINVAAYNRMSTEQKLEAIAYGMKNATDQNAAYAAAMDIMGTRNAPKLMEVLQRLGKDGYAALATDIKKTNKIMSEADAQELDAAADSIAKMQQNLTLFTGDKVAFWLQFFSAAKSGKTDLEGVSNEVRTLIELLDKLKAFPGKMANTLSFGLTGQLADHRAAANERKKQEKQAAYDEETRRMYAASKNLDLNLVAPTAGQFGYQAPSSTGSNYAAPSPSTQGNISITRSDGPGSLSAEEQHLLAEAKRTGQLLGKVGEQLKEGNDKLNTTIAQLKSERN